MKKIAVLLLLVVVLSACAPAPTPPPDTVAPTAIPPTSAPVATNVPPPNPPGTSQMYLSIGDNGKTVNATLNQILSITLESNATTGYKWNAVTEPDAKVLKLVSSQYVSPTPSKTPMVGAGGMEVWKYQVVGTGTAAIKLGYFRPFDPKNVAKEFTLTVTAK